MKTQIFFLITLMLLTAACSSANFDMLNLTDADADKIVEVKQGQLFQISLEGNLTLDYKQPWENEVAPEKTYEVTVVVK